MHLALFYARSLLVAALFSAVSCFFIQRNQQRIFNLIFFCHLPRRQHFGNLAFGFLSYRFYKHTADPAVIVFAPRSLLSLFRHETLKDINADFFGYRLLLYLFKSRQTCPKQFSYHKVKDQQSRYDKYYQQKYRYCPQ